MLCVLITGVLSLLGCAGPNKTASTAPSQMICEDGITTADALHAAEEVLTRMHFAIEKLDVGEGIVRTRPLRGAQFFELWRSDNASSYSAEEANLQSIRRSVEVRVRPEDRGQTTDNRRQRTDDREQKTAPSSVLSLRPGLCLECVVFVQRLSLPANEVAGTSEAYRIHSSSMPVLQRIDVSPQQRRTMTWINLGQDPDLAARILDRVEKRLGRMN